MIDVGTMKGYIETFYDCMEGGTSTVRVMARVRRSIHAPVNPDYVKRMWVSVNGDEVYLDKFLDELRSVGLLAE